MASPIVKVKRSETASAVPTLTYGELGVNITDKKIYVGNSTNTATLLVDGNASGSSSDLISYASASDISNSALSIAGISTYNEVGILTGSLAVDANDNFGSSVATSADGKTIIVGTPQDELSGTAGYGVVYVYDRVGSSFNQVGILTGSLAVDASDFFGSSVATSADGKTIIVSARQDEIGATTSTGVVYVFDRVGNSFNQVGILTGSLAVDANDSFGNSVATSADGKTIVVGATRDEPGATQGTGVVYVFDRVGNSFNQVGILTGSLAVDLGDLFGTAVATSADGKTIIVSANFDEIVATANTGVVYVFDRVGNSFNQVGILTGSLAVDANNNFGNSVATSADGKTIIVSATSDEIGATIDTGVVYVFDRVGNSFNQVGILTGSLATSDSDRFGSSVAASADGKTIVVGAVSDEIGATTSTGIVYVFNRQGNSFNQVGILSGSLAVDASDNFGSAIEISADGKTIIAGTSLDEIGATTSTGVVYVFDQTRETYVYSGPTGNIGIGTANPPSKLTVAGQFQSIGAGSTSIGGGQIYLNSEDNTGNRIDFNGYGSAAPSSTTRSAGTKIVLSPGAIDGYQVDNAIGIGGGTLWQSVISDMYQFKWYSGTAEIASLDGFGTLALSGGAYVSGNTGIGTTNPQTKLEINGVLGFTGGNVKIGDSTTGNTGGSYNVFMGVGAGTGPGTGAIGSFTVVNSSSVPAAANMRYYSVPCTGGSGTGALFNVKRDGSGNIYDYNITRVNGGTNYQVLEQITINGANVGGVSGTDNIVLSIVNFASPTGIGNNFIGHEAGQNNISGSNNNFLGQSAGKLNATGGDNNFFGFQAGQNNTTGYANNVFGFSAGQSNTVGYSNNFFGYYAGLNNTTGGRNIFIGEMTGNSNQTGSGNVCIGYGQNTPILNGSNQLVIGSGFSADNYWIVGNENFNVGIGTTNPTSKLTVGGQFQSTGIGTTTTGGGQIYLNGATSNRIDFNTNGTGAPTFTTRSNGTKIVLYPNVTATKVDAGFGVDNTINLWSSVPGLLQQFKWYAGTTNIATLFGTGELVLGTTTATGTASQPLQVTGGAYVSGNLGVGVTNPTSKLDVSGKVTITRPGDTGLSIRGGSVNNYASLDIGRDAGEASFSVTHANGQFANNSVAGDLVIRTESASAKILFTNAATNSTLTVAGNNVLVGTVSPTGTASQLLQVAGGAYVNGNVGISISSPTEKLDVNGKIKTNDSVIISDSQIKTTTTTITASSAQFTADTFSASTYRTTKYIVEVRETATSNFYTSEILLMHDGSEVYLTEYGTLKTPISPVSFIDADINSNNVRLLITPSVANTVTKISRISLTA
jgi:glutamate synthase domain-containing protein 3